jgi:hypothetical protein
LFITQMTLVDVNSGGPTGSILTWPIVATWDESCEIFSELVRRRPAGLELRLDAAVPRLDHVGRHGADEGVEGPAADRIETAIFSARRCARLATRGAAWMRPPPDYV